MKRKKFIIGAAVATAVGLPAVFYYQKSKKGYNTPEMPGMLALFCDEKTLKEIGAVYREKMPAENDKQKLTDILLTNAGGRHLKNTDKSAVSELLNAKTKEDFSKFNIFTLKGWVISQTEARQCALFSLTY
jgi:hypothetical protein